MILEIQTIYKKGEKQVLVDIIRDGKLYRNLNVSDTISFISSNNVTMTNFSIVNNTYFRGKNCNLRMEVLSNEQIRLVVQKSHRGNRQGCGRTETGTITERERGGIRQNSGRGLNSQNDRTRQGGSSTNTINTSTNDVRNVPLRQVSPKVFKKNFDTTKKSLGKWSICVDSHSEEELSDMCCLYRKNFGFVAVCKDGNICSVLKDTGNTDKGFVKIAMIDALRHSGTKLDCYAIAKRDNLIDKYMKLGFIPVCRVKFCKEYAPDGWDYSLLGEPDVVMMMHNLDTADEVKKKYGTYTDYDYFISTHDIPYIDDYDKALEYRDKKLKELMSNKYKKSVRGSVNRLKDAFSKVK